MTIEQMHERLKFLAKELVWAHSLLSKDCSDYPKSFLSEEYWLVMSEIKAEGAHTNE